MRTRLLSAGSSEGPVLSQRAKVVLAAGAATSIVQTLVTSHSTGLDLLFEMIGGLLGVAAASLILSAVPLIVLRRRVTRSARGMIFAVVVLTVALLTLAGGLYRLN